MAANNAGNWIRFNVGGKVFHTTKQTLRKYPGSFLALLCDVEGIQPSEKDESGAYLIDRDPEHFRLILNFLRNGSLDADANLPYDGLRKEAEFYGLTELAALMGAGRNDEVHSPGTRVITMSHGREEGVLHFIFGGDDIDASRLLIIKFIERDKLWDHATGNLCGSSLSVITNDFPLLCGKMATILRDIGFKIDRASNDEWVFVKRA